MITPIRGRKLLKITKPKKGASKWIRNDNPDKGTETRSSFFIPSFSYLRLEMITPIRGRKQISTVLEDVNSPIRIRNDNPDKGTETRY